jgi:hypothetical protein
VIETSPTNAECSFAARISLPPYSAPDCTALLIFQKIRAGHEVIHARPGGEGVCLHARDAGGSEAASRFGVGAPARGAPSQPVAAMANGIHSDGQARPAARLGVGADGDCRKRSCIFVRVIRETIRRESGRRYQPTEAQIFHRIWPIASRPALVSAADGGKYVVKGSQNARMLFSECVCGRLGHLIGAPTVELTFVDVAALRQSEPQIRISAPDSLSEVSLYSTLVIGSTAFSTWAMPGTEVGLLHWRCCMPGREALTANSSTRRTNRGLCFRMTTAISFQGRPAGRLRR